MADVPTRVGVGEGNEPLPLPVPLALPQGVVAVDVEPARPHEAALLGREAAPVEALEGRLRGRAHEEGVAGHEVERRGVEAHRLHHVPRQLPEGEPHEPQRLRRQQAQPAPQLAPHLRGRGRVDRRLLSFHSLKLALALARLAPVSGSRRLQLLFPGEDAPDGLRYLNDTWRDQRRGKASVRRRPGWMLCSALLPLTTLSPRVPCLGC
jgi:hypothetical protein